MTIAQGLDAVPDRTTVAIAGGGPSGTYLALRLARAGIDSVVIEPRIEVDQLRPRAKTTNARTMSLLAGIGLAERVRETAALPVSYSQDVIFCTSLRGHELRRFHQAFQLIDGDYGLSPECGQQIPQPQVEQVLREAAAQSEHITFVTGVRALNADPSASTVSVASAAADDGAGDDPDTVELAAKWIIGADGGTSRVRKSLGIAFQGTSAPRPNFNVVFTSSRLRKQVSIDPAVQWWIVNESTSGMIGELDRDGTWWAILQGCEPMDDPAEVAAAIRTMAGVGPDVDIEVLATDSWTARMLLADSYGGRESDGRIFLVGDAAHLNPPWGGHGFNTCISDAENLAWKLIAVHEGWASSSLLDSYEEERRPVAARMIADAAANGKALAYDFVDPQLDEAGDQGDEVRSRVRGALAVKASEFHSEGLVLGYEYAGTSRVAPGPTPFVDAVEYRPQALPGCLLPHFRLTSGASVYPEARGFTVFVTGDAAAHLTTEVLERTAREGSIPLRVVRLSGPDAEAAREHWGEDLVLVRPDLHIAATASASAKKDGGHGDGVGDDVTSPDAVLAAALLTAVGTSTTGDRSSRSDDSAPGGADQHREVS
ncbi:2-polyprenyl-6-methoxyphenol hydroxylase [Brevibacterium permense]|uniref:FAD-dependent monooxygenase n=1 Tax=Brevibacterium permense TaxID=234834 RepID=UPI0021D0B3DB|nr:2-polyprenyl-6-methoxyphenol hydroxylase [Brevibacterium permense]